jgi:trimethylamine---corrinoid protein Co-methyltransferase
MKQGSPAGSLTFLSDSQLAQIHEAGLSLLMDPGIYCESDLVLRLMAAAGAQVDLDSKTVNIPSEMVDAALQTVPHSFVLHGMDAADDILVETGRVYFGMGGSSEPMVYDYDLGKPRKPAYADMVRITRVGQALGNMDFLMTLCTSGDVPVDQAFFYDLHAVLRYTTKPIGFTLLDRRYTSHMLEMLAAVAGGETEARQRPRLLAFATPVSPLIFPKLIEGIVDAVEFGLPILYAPGPMMSATGPSTVAGLMAQTVAECLFGLVLVQAIKPGAPMMFKMDSDVMDPVTGQCTYASPEQSLGKAALAQMSAFYGVPSFTMGGGAEAKLPDSEAAAQAMMSMLMNGLAGITMSQSSGTLASGMYGAAEQVVICDEMALMVKRILRGFSVDEDALALDVIRQVGAGGTFLMESHTLEHFKDELFFPNLFRRQSIDQWISRGAKPMAEVAHEKVLEIMASGDGVVLSDDRSEALDRALQAAAADHR